jgi:hypothetical protein
VSQLELLPLEPLAFAEGWNPDHVAEGADEPSSLEILQEQRGRDVSVRTRLLIFSILLTITAPFVSYLYPTAWTYILATGVAFTIGTNLLISVVSTRVEDKAGKLETRMVELLDSLNLAAMRLEVFHEQIESVNIPAVQAMLENIRNEVAPGLQSLDDLDVGQIAYEIRRASHFVDTLDMEKVGVYISHIKKEEVPANDDDDDDTDYWGDEEEFHFDEPLVKLVPSQKSELPDLSQILKSQVTERQRREGEILSRLIG